MGTTPLGLSQDDARHSERSFYALCLILVLSLCVVSDPCSLSLSQEMAGVREELAKCYRNAEKERTSFLTMLQEKEHLVGELRQAASDANGRLEAAVADTQIRERDQMQATIAQMVAGMVEDRAKLRQGIRDEIQTEFEANKAAAAQAE